MKNVKSNKQTKKIIEKEVGFLVTRAEAEGGEGTFRGRWSKGTNIQLRDK